MLPQQMDSHDGSASGAGYVFNSSQETHLQISDKDKSLINFDSYMQEVRIKIFRVEICFTGPELAGKGTWAAIA